MKRREPVRWEVRTPRGEVHGPLGTQEIIERLVSDRLSGLEWVRHAERGAWLPLLAVAEFRHFCPPEPPPPSASPPKPRLLVLCVSVLLAFGVGLWVL